MMSSYHFESFCVTIGQLPPPVVVKFAARERQTIEDDFQRFNKELREEELSIWNFCRFLENAATGVDIPPCLLPSDHVKAYRAIVVKLVQAGQLPASAKQQFDTTFTAGFFQACAA